MSQLTHLDADGHAYMVDVGEKAITRRRAVAEGRISMQPMTLERILDGKHKKGDVLAAARIAGIMAAKRTSELIPLCHLIAISSAAVTLEAVKSESCVICRSEVLTEAKTGVEMEALVAVQIALLTIYDMCKSIDRGMTIDSVRLLEKSGGRSGSWQRLSQKD